jgi:hypothetical protein
MDAEWQLEIDELERVVGEVHSENERMEAESGKCGGSCSSRVEEGEELERRDVNSSSQDNCAKENPTSDKFHHSARWDFHWQSTEDRKTATVSMLVKPFWGSDWQGNRIRQDNFGRQIHWWWAADFSSFEVEFLEREIRLPHSSPFVVDEHLQVNLSVAQHWQYLSTYQVDRLYWQILTCS